MTVRTLLLTAAAMDIAGKQQGMETTVMESDMLPSLEHWVDLQSRKDGFRK